MYFIRTNYATYLNTMFNFDLVARLKIKHIWKYRVLVLILLAPIGLVFGILAPKSTMALLLSLLACSITISSPIPGVSQ